MLVGSPPVQAAPTDTLTARILGGNATVALAALLRGDDRLLQVVVVSRKQRSAGTVSFSVDRHIGQAAVQGRGLRFVGWGLLVEGTSTCKLTAAPPALRLRNGCEAGWIVREWDMAPLNGQGVSFTLPVQEANTPAVQPATVTPAPITNPTLSPTATPLLPITPTATILTPTTMLTAELTNQLVPTQVPSTVEPTIVASPTASTSSTITPTATAAAVMLADNQPLLEQPPTNITAAGGLPIEMKVWTATPLLQPTVAAASMVEPQPVNSEPAASWYIFGWHLQPDRWWLVYAAVLLLLVAVGWLLIHKQVVTKQKLQTFITNLKQRTGGQAQP